MLRTAVLYPRVYVARGREHVAGGHGQRAEAPASGGAGQLYGVRCARFWRHFHLLDSLVEQAQVRILRRNGARKEE